MFVTIPKSLLTILQAAPRGIVPANDHFPILTCVKLTVHPGQPFTLHLEASDLTMHLTRTVTLPEPAVHGSVAVPYREFSRIRPTGTAVHLHLADGQAVFTDSAGPTYRMDTQPIENFPPAPEPPPTGPATTLRRALLTAIQNAIPFASTDETRHVLNGVFATPTAVIATDGRRLIVINAPGTPIPCIIPTKTARIITGLFAQDPHAAFDSDGTAIHLGSPGITLYSRLIEGNYPNWRQVIPAPDSFTSRLTFATPEAVVAFAARLPDRGKGYSMTLSYASPRSVRISHPKGEMTTPAAISRPFRPIGFNPAFFAAAIKAAGPTLQLIDPMSPAAIFAPSATAILMPMRVHQPETETAAA